MVARIGGDEFVVLLEGRGAYPDTAAQMALVMAGTVRAALAASLDLDGQVYQGTASIGVVLALPGGSSAHGLLREADIAMYHAKARHAGRHARPADARTRSGPRHDQPRTGHAPAIADSACPKLPWLG